VKLKIGIAAAAAAALVAAGCGGTAGGNKPASGAASIAPGNAAAYIALDSNLDSPGWTTAKALLVRFPGKAKIIASLRSSLEQQDLDWETDVKPALGSEIDLVWLDFQNGGEDLVGMTKPKDAAKFNALLDHGSNPKVHEQIDGWTVFAAKQAQLDQLKKARDDSGSLGDDSSFTNSFDGLSGDSIAEAWIRGSSVQTAFDQRLEQSGAPADATKKQVGSLDAISAAVAPGSDGIRLNVNFDGNLDLGGGHYHADLPGSLPGGAMLYLSFNGLGDRLNKLVDTLASSNPSIDQQRAQIELVLGYPLKDVFGLLSGEGGFALYPTSGSTPHILFVAKVSDEDKARKILTRLVTLAAASGSLHVQTAQIGSVQADEITLGNGTHVFVAVFGGKLAITYNRADIEAMQAGGPKLADDAAYKAAVQAAGAPGETGGFLYMDLRSGLPYAFDYAESHGRTIPEAARANTAPLRGLFLYGSKTDQGFSLTGFMGIQ
jgi:hypothetical protein